MPEPLLAPANAFEALELVPSWSRLVKRSGVLDGSLPLRAAKFCPPVVQGSAAGFQLMLRRRVALRLRGGELALNVAEADQPVLGQCAEAMATLVARRLIQKGSFWHKLFKGGPLALHGSSLFVWSGALVRPTLGSVLFVTRAYNRHSRIEVVEHLIEAGHCVPLVIEVDATRLGAQWVMLQDEIACVTPLRPGMKFDLLPLREAPQVGQAFVNFHNETYEAEKLVKPTGHYIRHKVSNQPESSLMRTTVANSWPKKHVSVKRLARFATPRGLNRSAPSASAIESAVVLSTFELKADFDGRLFSDFALSAEPKANARYRALWPELYGEAGIVTDRQFEFCYESPPDERGFNTISPAMCMTPEGWVSIVDGFRFGSAWGLRGVIETNWYPGLTTLYRFDGPAKLHLRSGLPLLRVIPVPRALLAAQMKKLTLEELSDSRLIDVGPTAHSAPRLARVIAGSREVLPGLI